MRSREQWAVPSVQESGVAVLTMITADDEAGTVLMGTADRSLTHLTPAEALKLSDALQEAARYVDPQVGTGEDPVERALLDALRAFIASESG